MFQRVFRFAILQYVSHVQMHRLHTFTYIRSYMCVCACMSIFECICRLTCKSVCACQSFSSTHCPIHAERLLASKQFNMSNKHTAQWAAAEQSEREREQEKDRDEKRWEVKKDRTEAKRGWGRERKKLWTARMRMRDDWKWKEEIHESYWDRQERTKTEAECFLKSEGWVVWWTEYKVTYLSSSECRVLNAWWRNCRLVSLLAQ